MPNILILLAIPPLAVCSNICQEENTSENEINIQIASVLIHSEIQPVSMFNIYMDALSMHFKGTSA